MSTAETWPRSRARMRSRWASAQREHHAPGDELAVVGLQQRADPRVGERRRHLLDDDPHHLLGRDAVGDRGGDERPGARADVDVELVDGPVDRQQIERAQRADLVDPAGEAAAAEHERGLGAPRRRRPPARRATPPRSRPRTASSLTTLPMRRRILGRDAPVGPRRIGRTRRRTAAFAAVERLHTVDARRRSAARGVLAPRSACSRRPPAAPRRPGGRAAAAQRPERARCDSGMRAAGRHSGAYVVDLTTGQVAVTRHNARRRRGCPPRSRSSTRPRRRCCGSAPNATLTHRGLGVGQLTPAAPSPARSTCAAAATRRSARPASTTPTTGPARRSSGWSRT